MNREDLLKLRRAPATMETDYCGGKLTLQEISAAARVELLGMVAGDAPAPTEVLRLNCALLAASAVDDLGAAVLNAAEWEQLADADLDKVLGLGQTALTFNKMTGDSVEAVAKN